MSAQATPGIQGQAPAEQLSQQLLMAARLREPTDSLQLALYRLDAAELEQQLDNDAVKKAFWLNVYNAYTQIALSRNAERYTKREKFFGDKQIAVAGKKLSLDDVEHGILRRSKVKWSMGYLGKWFPGQFEKQNRVNKVDYRIHFALNCGAKSCPPIAFYNSAQIDKQLDLATKAYLKAEAEFEANANEVHLPAIMGWFRGDFGGKNGMMQLLKKLEIVPVGSSPTIRFKKYDWSLYLSNYAEASL